MKTLWLFIVLAFLMMAQKSKSAGPPFAFWRNQAATVAASGTYSNTVWADSPRYWWKLDDATGGTNVVDRMGVRNGLALPNNGTVWQGGLFRLPGIVDTSTNYSMSFTNLTDSTRQILIGDLNDTEGRPTLTVEIWAKPTPNDGANAYKHLIQKGNPFGSFMPWSLRFDNYANQAVFSVTTNASGAGSITGFSSDLTTNVWHHLVGRVTSTNISLFVDGAVVSTVTSASPIVASADTVNLGYGGIAGWLFYGGMDEAAIYTNALTDSQILNHYNAGR